MGQAGNIGKRRKLDISSVCTTQDRTEQIPTRKKDLLLTMVNHRLASASEAHTDARRRLCKLQFSPVPTPDYLLLDSAPNLGPLIARWEINKFENSLYKSVRILEVLKLLFQQFLNS
jgi:hypothetical protein